MLQDNETFFTTVGCMDGRCQRAIADFGRKKFGAEYPDTITEAGIVGKLASDPTKEFLDALKEKLIISLEKHHSKGIIVHGHQECAGNPVPDNVQKDEVRRSVVKIQEMVVSSVHIVGVFVRRSDKDPSEWAVEEL